MPQIAIIQPATPQAPPISPSTSGDAQSFSPHLDKAISSTKNTNDTAPKQLNGTNRANEKKIDAKRITGSKKETTDTTPALDQSEQKTVNSAKDPEVAIDDTQTEDQASAQNNIVIFMATSQTISQSVWKNQADAPATPALNQSLVNNSQLFEFNSQLFEFLSKTAASSDKSSGQPVILSQNFLGKAPNADLLSPLLAKALDILTTKPDASSNMIQSLETKSETSTLAQQLQKIIAENDKSGKISITVTSSTANEQTRLNNSQATMPSVETSALLQQLQKIIAENDKSGKISITVTNSTAKEQTGLNNSQATMPSVTSTDELLPQLSNSTNFSGVTTQSSVVVASNNIQVSDEQNNQDVPSLRNSLRQQYFEGKFALQNNKENNTSTEEGEQQDTTFAPKGTQLQEKSAISSLSGDQTNTFAQPLSLAQEGQRLQTAEGQRPVTLPSGTVVQQEEVIRQIAEHFQISRRNNDTKVNIQLHPAELGELKIGLTLKEGSVHANVVASSQYAQEIIEKNMAKLRTVLENQGFTVGEMSITCKSETAGDFNLFERQLFSKNDYTPPSTKQTQTPGSLFTMENLSSQEQPRVSGVNVKI